MSKRAMPFTRLVIGLSTKDLIPRAILSPGVLIGEPPLADRLGSASAGELQPRVILRGAQDPEVEVVVILPGDLAGQRAVLAVLIGEGEGPIGEGGLAGDGHG